LAKKENEKRFSGEKRRLRSNGQTKAAVKESPTYVPKKPKVEPKITIEPLKELATVATDWKEASCYISDTGIKIST
jgi:hypothetical protein